jgi:hypothetical protein
MQLVLQLALSLGDTRTETADAHHVQVRLANQARAVSAERS